MSTIIENPDKIRIEIDSSQKSIIKFGFVFQGLLIFGAAFFYLWGAIEIHENLPVISYIILALFFFFLYVGNKYLNTVFFKEFIIIEKDTLCICSKTLLGTKEYKFRLEDIRFFGYNGYEKFTQHTMHNNVVDFTGLSGSEKELQYIIANGTMIIKSDSETLRFGKNVPSWEAQKIISKIKKITGRTFLNKNPHVRTPQKHI